MKLVRSKIPEMYPQNEYVELRPIQYEQLLLAKLVEEAMEALQAYEQKASSDYLFNQDEVLRELADLQEVIDQACRLMKNGKERLLHFQDEKRATNGNLGRMIALTKLNLLEGEETT